MQERLLKHRRASAQLAHFDADNRLVVIQDAWQAVEIHLANARQVFPAMRSLE
jgi:hypothetical protein